MPPDVVSEWGKRVNPFGGLEKPLTAEADGIRIRERQFLYAQPDGSVLDAAEMRTMSASARTMAMKKLLLRRLLIAKGNAEGMFNEDEAILFLLPRLEQAMEDYYLLKKTNQAGREENVRQKVEELKRAGKKPEVLETAAREVLAADREKERARILLGVLSDVRLEVREEKP
jgi:hypothetical protein